MEITKLTRSCSELNHLVDAGLHAEVSIDITRNEINAGTIFEFLERRFSEEVEFSILDNDDRAELVSEWRRFNGIKADRKLGVSENGICLLVAYLLEGIQQRARSLENQYNDEDDDEADQDVEDD
jgi:hypothetical protein